MSTRIRTAVIALFGVAAICAAVLYINRPAPAPAKAGDCVTAPVGGSFQQASCGDSSAKYRVLQIFAGQDANECEQTAGAVEAVRETNGSEQSILCLGAHG